MGDDYGAYALTWSSAIAKQSISLQQDKEEPSSSSSRPRNRRKRRRTCEGLRLQQPVSGNRLNLGRGEETPSPSKVLDVHLFQGLESKVCCFFVNKYDQKARKKISRVHRNLSKVVCIGDERKEEAKFYSFFKEIDDAITRIESLIPALEILVKNSAFSHPNSTHLVNTIPSSNECKSPADGGTNMLSQQAPLPLKLTLIKNESVKTQIPEQLQDNLNQNRTSLGSAKFVPNRISHLSKSEYKQRKSLPRRTTALEKGIPSRKIVLHRQISEDTSRASSRWTPQQSDSPPSSSWTYQSTSSGSGSGCGSENFESEVKHGKRHEASDCTSGYATSSYYSSQDQYSDAEPSSQSSLTGSLNWKPTKGEGRFKRFKKKLGLIFHHHHHHHHHYCNESDVGHVGSLWKRLGKMFQHKKKRDCEKPKANKSRKAVVKSVPNKHQGHLHALVGRLISHLRHSKKSKKVMDDFTRLGNSHRGGRKKAKKLPWWPKIHGGRGGVKVSNKGRVKLGTRTKRPPLAAAKMIFRQ